MNQLKVLFFLLFSGAALFVSAQKLDMDLFTDMKPRNIGPAGMSGRVTAIDVVLKNPNVIYIGSASGGAWRSENGGTSWKPVFQNEKAASVGAIAINQNNPNEIWIGTGEGNPRNSVSSGYGVYKTIDRGKTWTHIGLENTRNIHRLILHPTDSKIAWAASIGSPWGEHPEKGVFKTMDGGKTWQKVLFVNNKVGCGDLVLDPENPNKLIASMWEHQRYPWYFNSGGKGSGLYISYDGGETWKQKKAADGLPKGELGRIGLAIAPSRTNKVYAWIESKKNGLYQSLDGGEKWTLVSNKNIGNRPFYYADIYVDPQNENRLYNIYTFTDVSEDGGKTFKRFIPSSLIHVDNHALWIHPTDPNFIINGNDGGLAITRDRGATWDYPENLPIGQFYHIRTDNEVPYNVYGGMQDNGSWRGPSQVWRRKGIRNLYWNRIGYGDGFDAMPDPLDARRGYSSSQGGNILRYDLATGAIRGIKPFLGDGTKLRFNWNAAMAMDPFDNKTVYYGSQYLLKTVDKGDNWTKISPDLSTNDPAKQQQITTGGLNIDDTGAENHTTIITIAPSPLQKDVLWVGTDDGNVQLTQDGGTTWTNLTDRITGVPQGSWVAQIQASKHNPAAAFVVINNYRRDDWTPYVYQTTNFGKTWNKVVQQSQVWGYALSFEQDPIAPNLFFLGTEFGLYVSVDAGKNWTKWTKGYPTVSTMDMTIHPIEHDLVLGTFGRSNWVLDDIRPLRQMASLGAMKVTNQSLFVFDAPNAYLAHLGEPNGYRSTGNGIFMGENREPGALISYYVKEPIKKKADKIEKIKLDIFNDQGDKIRSLKAVPKKGINRITWKLDSKGIRYPRTEKPKKDSKEPRGRSIIPGKYKAIFSYGKQSDSTNITVKADPKLTITLAEMTQKAALIDRQYQNVGKVTTAADNLREVISTVDMMNKQLKKLGNSAVRDTLISLGATQQKTAKAMLNLLFPPKDFQGISRNEKYLQNQLQNTGRYLQNTLFPPTPTHEHVVAACEKAIAPVMEKINGFLKGAWQEYRKEVAVSQLNLVPSFEE